MVAGASPAQAAPGLRVAITDGRAFASPGDPIRYTITVVNPDDESATQLTARQVLADGLIFVSASDGGRWDAAGRVVRWPRFSLGPRLTQELTVEARVRPNAPIAQSSTTVSLTGAGVAVEAADQTWISPALEVRITDGREAARPGDVLTYTITVADPEPAGPVPVSVVDTLPPGLEFVSAPGAIFDPGTRRVTWQGFGRRSGG